MKKVHSMLALYKNLNHSHLFTRKNDRFIQLKVASPPKNSRVKNKL